MNDESYQVPRNTQQPYMSVYRNIAVLGGEPDVIMGPDVSLDMRKRLTEHYCHKCKCVLSIFPEDQSL